MKLMITVSSPDLDEGSLYINIFSICQSFGGLEENSASETHLSVVDQYF